MSDNSSYHRSPRLRFRSATIALRVGACVAAGIGVFIAQRHLEAASPLARLTTAPATALSQRSGYQAAVDQSPTEQVADLGNIEAIQQCGSDYRNDITLPNELRHWTHIIPTNPKVARLIEEGRASPDEVAPLLVNAIKDCMTDYDQDRNAMVAAFMREGDPANPAPPEWAFDYDGFYAKHRKNSGPENEWQRVNYVIYASFYILANIDRFPDGRLLNDWIKKDKWRDGQCNEFDAWLIDRYYKTGGRSMPGWYANLLQRKVISGQMTRITAWDASSDIDDPRAAVYMTEMRMINALYLPTQLNLDPSITQDVVAQFQAQF